MEKVFVNAALIALLGIAAPLSLHAAGGSYGGGGNVVICKGQPAVVLDYYHAKLPTLGKAAEILNINDLSEAETIRVVSERIGKFLRFRAQVRDALEDIGEIDTWIATDLKQVDDSAEPYLLPKDCRRLTAAFRQNPADMYVDPIVIAQLSPAQKGLLRLHEAFYLISSTSRVNARTSIGVRNLMRELLKLNPDPTALRKRIDELGGDSIDYSSLEMVTSGTYKIQHREWNEATKSWIDVEDGSAVIEIDRESGRLKVVTNANIQFFDVKMPASIEFNCSSEVLIESLRKNNVSYPYTTRCWNKDWGFKFPWWIGHGYFHFGEPWRKKSFEGRDEPYFIFTRVLP